MANKNKPEEFDIEIIGGQELSEHEEQLLTDYFSKKYIERKKANSPIKGLKMPITLHKPK